ncbi:MAG: hypothetical protein Q9187_007234 [Circinaria calcarea]
MRVDRTDKLPAEILDVPTAGRGSMVAAAAVVEGIGWIDKTLSRMQGKRELARLDLDTRIGWRYRQSRDDRRLRGSDVAAVDMDVRTDLAVGEEERQDGKTRPYEDVCDSLVHVNEVEEFHHPSHHRQDLDTDFVHIHEVDKCDLGHAEVLDPAVDRGRHKSLAVHLACTSADRQVAVASVRCFGDGDTRYVLAQMHALATIQE